MISPASPQRMMSNIGFILYFDLEKKKASPNIATLITNEYISVDGAEKFSWFINTKAAAARRPTTAGLKPLNTASTMGWELYLKKNLLISSIKINEGSTTAKVAVIEPQTLPFVAVYPT